MAASQSLRMRVGGLIDARDMEWGEVGNNTIDGDEERVFQSVLEEQLACYNGRPVVTGYY